MSILSSLLKLGQGAPTQQIPTAVQTTEIAKEVAPFIKDILGKSQALYKQRMAEGFVPFEGQTLADVTANFSCGVSTLGPTIVSKSSSNGVLPNCIPGL